MRPDQVVKVLRQNVFVVIHTSAWELQSVFLLVFDHQVFHVYKVKSLVNLLLGISRDLLIDADPLEKEGALL